MYKLKSEVELKKLKGTLETAVYKEAERIVKILDVSYNSRNLCGGHLYILEEDEKMESIRKMNPTIILEEYEFMDTIFLKNQKAYVSLLCVLSAENTVSLLIPRKNLPMEILQEEKRRIAEDVIRNH